MFMLTFLSKIHQACHYDANGIKTDSKLKLTDKPAAECSKAAFNSLLTNSLCVMYINLHTII